MWQFLYSRYINAPGIYDSNFRLKWLNTQVISKAMKVRMFSSFFHENRNALDDSFSAKTKSRIAGDQLVGRFFFFSQAVSNIMNVCQCPICGRNYNNMFGLQRLFHEYYWKINSEFAA